jgi:hypothetical protein
MHSSQAFAQALQAAAQLADMPALHCCEQFSQAFIHAWHFLMHSSIALICSGVVHFFL